jgi:hypothetical protein
MLTTVNAVGEAVGLFIPGPVLKAIDEYSGGGATDPGFEHGYEDSTDGVVKYYDLGFYKKVVYDQQTDKLVVLKTEGIDIYNASSMSLEKSIISLLTPVCMDADDGKLVVGYNTKQIQVYDLSENKELKTITTEIDVHEIVIDNEMVIYADGNQHCRVVFQNLVTDEKVVSLSVYEPLLTLNRKDHILYVTETRLSTSSSIYYSSQTGQKIFENPDFVYVSDRILFDGRFIHHEDKTFDAFNGTKISSNYLNRNYTPLNGFTPDITLFDSEKFSFVASKYEQRTTAIYDNINKQFIYSFPVNINLITDFNDGKYLARCSNYRHIAIVDGKLINEDLVS